MEFGLFYFSVVCIFLFCLVMFQSLYNIMIEGVCSTEYSTWVDVPCVGFQARTIVTAHLSALSGDLS